MQRYRRLRDLASGGMGVVELVVREEGAFQRLQARKRLHRRYLGDAELERMFVEEARLAASIRHPNVVSVHDMGADEDGPFLIMDYVHGVALSTLIKTAESLPEALVLRILRDVARGLSAAHEARAPNGDPLCIVHRDVTPQNILLSFDDHVMLTDFGIAKASLSPKTSTGLLKGKSGYFAPEQLDFFPATPKTDLFALGIVAWEAFAGRRLYRRDTPLETARAIKSEAPPDLYDVRPELSPETSLLVLELLAKTPEERPASAAEVVARCDELLEEQGLGASLTDVLRQLDLVTPSPSFALDEPKNDDDDAKTLPTKPTPKSNALRRGLLGVSALLALALALASFAWQPQASITKAAAEPVRNETPATVIEDSAEDTAETDIETPVDTDNPEVDAPEVSERETTATRRPTKATRRPRMTETPVEPPDCASAPSWAQVPGCP